MKNFVLVGAAGYIAPKHFEAIKSTWGNLAAIHDPYDSVGIIDRYFQLAKYFKNAKDFEGFCKDSSGLIDYFVICSPNYTHFSYCKLALQLGADAICEKPVVLYEQDINQLLELERSTGHKVWTIMQLRLGTVYPTLQEMFAKNLIPKNVPIKVTYTTPRGDWYDQSWKSDIECSGGLIFNIGVHIIDLLCSIFGPTVHVQSVMSGYRSLDVSLAFASGHSVDLWLSTQPGRVARRTITIGNKVIDLSEQFTDLHIKSYQKILAGEGFGLETSRLAIRTCNQIREQNL